MKLFSTLLWLLIAVTGFSPVLALSEQTQYLSQCDFENGTFCTKWHNVQNHSKIVSPVDVESIYAPLVDHSLGSMNGHYVQCIAADCTILGDFPTDRQMCLQFAFVLNGEGLDESFLVKAETSHHVNWPLYQGYVQNDISWRVVSVDVPHINYQTISFNFHFANPTQGFGALDDVSLTDVSRDFYHMYRKCTLLQTSVSDGVRWTKMEASKANLALDHTTHLPTGHVYSISLAHLPSNGTYLAQSAKTYSGEKCVQFSYYIDSVNSSLFIGAQFNESQDHQLWSVTGSTNGMWFTHYQQFLSFKTQYRIVLGIEERKNESVEVFIDDFKFHIHDQCPMQNPCNFEQGNLCEMESIHRTTFVMNQDELHQIERLPLFSPLSTRYLTNYVNYYWLVVTGKRASLYGSGKINVDYTTQSPTGKYLLFSPRVGVDNAKGVRGIVVTPRYPIKFNQWMCLYFSLYKKDNSRIEVYQGESGLPGFGYKLWQLDQTKSLSKWEVFGIRTTLQFPNSSDIHFYLIGTVNGNQGNIGLDDVGFVSYSCSNPSNEIPHWPTSLGSTVSTMTTPTIAPDRFDCGNGMTIPREKLCDYHLDCANGRDETNCGSCTFENDDLCGFKIVSDVAYFQFRFADKSSVGPTDVSSGLLVASETMLQKHVHVQTKLYSPLIHQAYQGCTLSFTYFLNTTKPIKETDYGMIVAILIPDLNTRTVVWQSSLEPKLLTQNAIQVNVPLNRIPHTFQVVFTANSLQSTTSYHALANIKLKSCAPITPNPSKSCNAASEFRCQNLVCLSDRKLVCNFVDNCGDASDEANCDSSRMFSFENHAKGGFEGFYDNLRLWSDTYSRDMRTAPTFDHTNRYTAGSYVFFESQQKDKYDLIDPVLLSPTFRANGMYCEFGFYYLVSTRNVSVVLKLQNVQTGGVEILDIEQQFFQDYQFLNYFSYAMPTVKRSIDYRLMIIVYLNRTRDQFAEPYFALDDFRFSSDCNLVADPPVTPPTTTPEPPCDGLLCESVNGTGMICLLLNRMCNFVQDCKSGEDERQCGTCDFDDTHLKENWTRHQLTCGWRDISLLREKFEYIEYATIHPWDPFPTVDGSNHSKGGYMTAFESVRDKFESELTGPIINANTQPDCQMSFMYYSGKLKGTFEIKVNEKSVDSGTFVDTKQEWILVNSVIGAQKAPFSISINVNGQGPGGETVAFSLDNIKLEDCGPKSKPNRSEPGPISALNCDFETNLCGWVLDSSNCENCWQRTNDKRIEPGTDHTSLIEPKPAKSGYWLASAQNQIYISTNSGWLQSLHLLLGSKSYCLSFWYYYYGFEMGSFRVLRSWTPDQWHTDVDHILWVRDIPLARDWQQAFVELPAINRNYYLNIIGTITGHTINGLDDISVTEGSCHVNSAYFCDFELNTCDWSNVTGDFQRVQASEQLPDHTTGTKFGHYLQDSKGSSQIRKNMKTVIREIGNRIQMQYFCLSLYYHISTKVEKLTKNSILTILQGTIIQLQPTYQQLRQVSLADAINYGLLNRWNELRVNIHAHQYQWIEIGVSRDIAQTIIRLDDIRMASGQCELLGNCDFENDMCGWNNEVIAPERDAKYFLWMRTHPNSNFFHDRQLSFDHTIGSGDKGGNYLLLALEVLHHKYVSLISPLLNRVSESICFKMFYFAKSSNQSLAAMNLTLIDASNNRVLSFALIQTTPTLMWTIFQFHTPHLPPYFYFVLKPLYSAQLQSDLGLDDIKLIQGPCLNYSIPTTTTPIPVTEKVLDCDFENAKLCNWKWNQTIWNVTDYHDSLGLEKMGFYPPRKDHSLSDPFGHYLMLKPSTKTSSTSILSIESSQSLKSNKPRCLHLWYYADGEYSFLITISARNTVDQLQTIVQYSSSIENRVWQLLRVEMLYDPSAPEIVPDYRLNISIKSMNPNQRLDIVALDDITVHPGHCEHTQNYVYTFSKTLGVEDLMVEHEQPLHSNSSQIYQPSSLQLSQVPPIDHTTQTSNGSYFLFMNTHDLTSTVYIDTMTLENLPRDFTGSCVRFAYQAIGEVKFKVMLTPENDYDLNEGVVYFQHRFPRDQWTLVEFNKNLPYQHKVILYFEKQLDNRSFVALDDLVVLNHQCEVPIDCDFDNQHYCSYSPFYEKNWHHFEVFTTPSEDPKFPGPKWDHTTGNYGGGYLIFSGYQLLESSQVLKAKVNSGPRRLRISTTMCFTMWTQVSSADAQLKVSILKYGLSWTDSNRTQLLVQHANHSQSQWTQWAQTLDYDMLQHVEELQVTIEGYLAPNSSGAIAIDDIKLTMGPCDNSGLICPENNIPVPRSKICNFVSDCPTGFDEIGCGVCNFETDECGWNDTKVQGNDRWVLVQASKENLKNSRAQPTDGSDHTLGHYMMMKPEPMASRSHAEMALNSQSPRMYLKQVYHSCVFSFDYYVNTSGQFYIQVKLGSEIRDLNTVYIISEQPQNGWNHAKVHLGEQRTEFFLDLDAYQEEPNGVIGLDNFNFSQCATPHYSKKQNCPRYSPISCPETFVCIKESDLCDGTNDCGNEWDENPTQCSGQIELCHFDSLFACHITTDREENPLDPNRNALWLVRQARSFEAHETVPGLEPLVDHTLGTRYGFYLLLEDQPQHQGILNPPFQSTFYSPTLTAVTSETCSLRFFYYFHSLSNSSQTRLNVYIRYVGKVTLEASPRSSFLSVSTNQQQWLKGVVYFRPVKKPFQFVFEGILPDSRSRMAIDDFSYGVNCRLYQEPQPSTVTTFTTGSAMTTTNQPKIHHTPKPGHSNKGGEIAAGILVPIFLIAFVAGGFLLYRRYRTRLEYLETTSTVAVSMRNIERQLAQNPQ